VTVGIGGATPALVSNKLYVFTRQAKDEITLCLDAKSGKELWQNKYEAVVVEGGPSRDHSGPRSSPMVYDGKVVTLVSAEYSPVLMLAQASYCGGKTIFQAGLNFIHRCLPFSQMDYA